MNTIKRKSFQETCWREKTGEARLDGGFTVETYKHSATVTFDADTSLFQGDALNAEGYMRMRKALETLVMMERPFSHPHKNTLKIVRITRDIESAESVQGVVSFQYETGASFYDGD